MMAATQTYSEVAMRIIRTIFAVVVALVMATAFVGPASAAGSPPNVAVVSIFSDVSQLANAGSSGFFSGHTWLVVKNISSDKIRVGRVDDVAPGETITVGTWGNKDEHKGVWYNLEAYFTHQDPLTFHAAAAL